MESPGVQVLRVGRRGTLQNTAQKWDVRMSDEGVGLVMEKDVKLTKLSECAGCGAKVGAGELAKLLGGLPVNRDPNLLVGYDRSDDACVYRISEDLAMVQTVDFFPPIVDDPFRFGAIAAANALSDIYAMGGEPKTALNVMAVPENMARETVHAILRGGYSKVFEAGAVIAGGHSIYDKEPKYGMAVTGFVHPEKMLTNSGAKPGDVLIYTKRLGIGVITSGAKAGMVSGETAELAEKQMMTLNRAARDIMVKYRVHACTDVTGFGMLGHSLEMAQGSDLEIHFQTDRIRFLPEAMDLAVLGILPAGMYRNRHFAEEWVEPGRTETAFQDLLYDPQTSGGLLISADPADADVLLEELQGNPDTRQAEKIAQVREYRGGKRLFLD